MDHKKRQFTRLGHRVYSTVKPNYSVAGAPKIVALNAPTVDELLDT